MRLSTLARKQGYVRPRITERPELDIQGGRHPILDVCLPAGTFVANDATVSPETASSC